MNEGEWVIIEQGVCAGYTAQIQRITGTMALVIIADSPETDPPCGVALHKDLSHLRPTNQ